MLTWKRFQRVSFHVLADDTGYAEVLPTKEELPEGVVKTKRGWRFLPRRRKGQETKYDNILYKKFVWKDMGKPLWFSYAGKVGSLNPATLAALQQTKSGNPTKIQETIETLKKQLKRLPKKIREGLFDILDLDTLLTELEQEINVQPLTIIDPTTIKELIPKMFTPSQIDALATNREFRGLKRAGKQFTPLILGMGLIVGMIVLAIIVLTFLK